MSENTINDALRALGYRSQDMTGHGFRSLASTLLNEQGWPPDAIERQLAHQEDDEVRGAYNYAQYLPVRRRMMQMWADYLDDLKRMAARTALEYREPTGVQPDATACNVPALLHAPPALDTAQEVVKGLRSILNATTRFLDECLPTER